MELKSLRFDTKTEFDVTVELPAAGREEFQVLYGAEPVDLGERVDCEDVPYVMSEVSCLRSVL